MTKEEALQYGNLMISLEEDKESAMYDFIATVVKVLDQDKWIPVETELPEVGSEVLVCYEFKKKRYVYIATFYGDGEFNGYDDEYLTTEGRKYRKAVAWMPLPKPPKLSEIPTCSGRSDEE